MTPVWGRKWTEQEINWNHKQLAWTHPTACLAKQRAGDRCATHTVSFGFRCQMELMGWLVLFSCQCHVRSHPPPSVSWAGLWHRTDSEVCLQVGALVVFCELIAVFSHNDTSTSSLPSLCQVSCPDWSKWPRPVPSWSARMSLERPFSANTTRRAYSDHCRPATPERTSSLQTDHHNDDYCKTISAPTMLKLPNWS